MTVDRRGPSLEGFVSDLRLLVLAGVALVTPFDPTLALRGGAAVCAVLLATALLRIRIQAPDLFAMGLTFVAVLSTTWAATPSVTALSVTNQLAVLAIFLVARTVIRDRRGLVVVGIGYLSGCLCALYLLVQQNEGARFVSELSDTRFGVEGLNFNYLAYSLATGLVVVVLLWNLRAARVLLAVTAAALAWGIVQSGSRGAVLAVACLIVWLILHRVAPRLGLRALGAAVIGVAVAIFVGWSDRLLLAVEGVTVRATGDLAGRFSVWPIARDTFWQEPWTGVGAGGFLGVNPYRIGAHNALLEIGTGMGAVGLLLFVGVIYTALISSSSHMNRRRRALLVGSLTAVWAPIYLSGHWELSPAAWMMLGLFSRLEAPGVGEVGDTLGGPVSELVEAEVQLMSRAKHA